MVPFLISPLVMRLLAAIPVPVQATARAMIEITSAGVGRRNRLDFTMRRSFPLSIPNPVSEGYPARFSLANAQL